MGISHSTACYLAPVSFLIHFAAQNYGMLSSPNMKDIHDANLSFFSPQPFFIAGFFFPQQPFQVGWLYRLWKLDDSKPEDRRELEQMVDFVPFYSLGNLRIAGMLCYVVLPIDLLRGTGFCEYWIGNGESIAWMVAWNANRLDISSVFVAINSFTQVYYITSRLEPMNTRSLSSFLTHIVSKTFAGIGQLDFLHNTSAAFFKDQPPNLTIKVLTGIGFGAASAFSDWIFGGCLVYDLVALAVRQKGSWRNLLGFYALGSAGIVTARNIARPPYIGGYFSVPGRNDL